MSPLLSPQHPLNLRALDLKDYRKIKISLGEGALDEPRMRDRGEGYDEIEMGKLISFESLAL